MHVYAWPGSPRLVCPNYLHQKGSTIVFCTFLCWIWPFVPSVYVATPILLQAIPYYSHTGGQNTVMKSILKECLLKTSPVLWDIMRHYETLWDVMRRPETLWDIMRHYETSWDAMRHYETPRDIMRCHETLWDIMRHYETPWDIMRHQETSWDIMRHHETLWDIMRHHETFWHIKRGDNHRTWFLHT